LAALNLVAVAVASSTVSTRSLLGRSLLLSALVV
jgi:hypothetical protein